MFYLFWRSATGSQNFTGGVWALLAGTVIAFVQFFLDSFIESGEFGLSRWLSGCVDIVVLPALAPIFAYLLLAGLKIVHGPLDFANFAQLWLIPGALIRALSWSSQNNPIYLVLVPILWTTISVGVPFFINLIIHSKSYFLIPPAALGILSIPAAAASSYWAFFSQKNSLGFLLLLAAIAPTLVSIILSYQHSD